jgi:hypothetical protein
MGEGCNHLSVISATKGLSTRQFPFTRSPFPSRSLLTACCQLPQRHRRLQRSFARFAASSQLCLSCFSGIALHALFSIL